MMNPIFRFNVSVACSNNNIPSTIKVVTFGSCLFLICTLYPVPGAGRMLGNETDHLALLSFRSLITKDPFQALASWDQSVQFCQWGGVNCSPRHPGRVISLSLASLELAGQISPSLSNLSFLKVLNLSNNNFDGSIPMEFGKTFRLKFLDLANNSLSGLIPTSLTTRCQHLTRISLAFNDLIGEIPHNLSRCLELVVLRMQRNKLQGSIPPELGNLEKLEVLNLYGNNLTGNIPPSLGNISTLKFLDLSENNLRGDIPVQLCRFFTQLGVLYLNANRLSGIIPPSCYNLSSLRGFDMQSNQIVGSLPPNIGFGFPNLQEFFINDNQIEGQIPASLSNATRLSFIMLSKNKFHGLIPSSFGKLKNLDSLTLDNNGLEAGEDWDFIYALANCSFLRRFYVGGNSLAGTLPVAVGNLSKNLEILLMDNNNITGSIPPSLGNLGRLTYLLLHDNQFSGSIPDSLSSLQQLEWLYLQNNRLTGEIPYSMGNLSRLTRVNLSGNHLVGSIPTTFQNFAVLQFLDLHNNKLTGELQASMISTPSSLYELDLSYNSFTKNISIDFASITGLTKLDLSHNNLSGKIPGSLGKCEALEYLYIQNNAIQGILSQNLTSLLSLKVLNISGNNFSGPISQFSSPIVEFIDLSFNPFLEGEVPTTGIFSKVGAFSLKGDAKLCGGIPDLGLPKCPSYHEKSIKTKHRLMIIILVTVSALVLTGICVLCMFMGYIPLNKNASAVFSSWKGGIMRLSYNDLLKATGGFAEENLLGLGSYGSVYKGVLQCDDSEKYVAVKVLNSETPGAMKSFTAECNALKCIRHRNLVSVLTSCSSIDLQRNDFKAIVYDFMSNGSLDDWLHGTHDERRSLSLLQRLNIAIDVGCALDYLHLRGEKPIVHCDLKPSNVLLDEDMIAHVGDFGLARFIHSRASKNNGHTTSSIGVKGSIGYIAPEYGTGGQVSPLGDLYSYGILLLEMITGKRPTDETFKDGFNIRSYVEMALNGKTMTVIDPELQMQNDIEEGSNVHNNDIAIEEIPHSIDLILKMGLLCSSEASRDRMKIEDVMKEMISIKEKLCAMGVA